MKTVIVLIGVAAIFGATFAGKINEEYMKAAKELEGLNYEQRLFEGTINKTINEFISVLVPYDPIHVDHDIFDIWGHIAEITGVHVQGFSNIAATQISLGGMITWTLKMEIEAPLITANVNNWNVLGKLFFGDGDVSVIIEDIKVKVEASINPITQYVKKLHVAPTIGNAEVSITGLYDNEKVSNAVSSVFNFLLNDFINDKRLHDALSETLLKIVQNK